MKILRIGYVYCNYNLAGEIQEYNTPTGAQYAFQYNENYIERGGVNIGVNLPLQAAPFVFNSLHPFFANLISEGWVKRHQAEMARLDQEDNFGLLLANGQELIGPISVLNTNKGDVIGSVVRTEIPRKNLKGYTINFARSEFDDIATKSLEGTSISGVQPKMFLTAAASAPKTLTNAKSMGPYIVKPSPDRFPELAENEYLIMQLCRAAGFKVTDHYLLPFCCGELAYVTTRFNINSEGLKTNFIEDLASCLNVAPGQKDNKQTSYEGAIKTAHNLSGGHAQVLVDGFLQVLMAYLVGNNDMHLKNMALWREKNSKQVKGFAPLYDMLSVAPYPAYEGEELSLWLLDSEIDNVFTSSYNHYGYYTGHDFIELAIRIGLGKKMGEALIAKLAGRVEKVAQKVVSQSPGSDKLKQLILKRIQDRIGALRRPVLV